MLGGAVVSGFLLWAVPLAWRRIAEYDKNPTRPSLKYQFMRRKSDAMHDLLDDVVDGRLDRAASEAAQIERFASTINGYLATDVYQRYGEDFYRSLEELQVAAGQNDWEAVKEATLRLEKSCIECHFLINQAAPDATDGQ